MAACARQLLLKDAEIRHSGLRLVAEAAEKKVLRMKQSSPSKLSSPRKDASPSKRARPRKASERGAAQACGSGGPGIGKVIARRMEDDEELGQQVVSST